MLAYLAFVDQKKNASIVNVDDLKVIWRVVAKNWYIPLLIIPVFYLLGYFYVYKLTDIYKASVELLKSNDTYYKSNLITDNSFYGSTGQSYVDNSNEIRIVKSYDLMKETVSKLKDRLQVSYYLVGRVRTTEQFSGMPFKVTVTAVSPGLYEQPIKITVLNYDEYKISYLSNGAQLTKTGRFDQDFIDVDFNIRVSRESNLTRNTINEVVKLGYQIVIHSEDNLVNTFQASLAVENPDYTNVLVISIEDIIPERAVLLLDTLSRVYINKSLKDKLDINERTIAYIDKQLEDISLSLKDVEDTMQNYKSKHAILDLDWEQQDFFKKITTYDEEKNKLGLKVEALNDLEKYVIEDKDPQFLPPSVFLVDADPFLSNSISELYKMQIALNNLYNSTKENNPNIADLKQNIKKLKQNMLVYINNSRNATYKIIENINTQINTYVSNIKQLPEKQRSLFGIKRKVDVNEGLYTFLLQNRASTKIARASIVSEVKVIDASRNQGVVKPDKKKIISTFVTVGLIISVLIIAIRFLFFTTIQTIEELKDKTFLPVISELPYAKGVTSTGFLVEAQPNSYITEAFRTLRTNLNYATLNAGQTTILITSNVPGEGKTFTTINLGAILANSGKKVIMLELDLHKPRIQKALEMTADIGVSTFMAGQNTIDQIIKPTQVKNLYTILSGPIPPNPSELILSEKLRELFDYVKKEFDFVLIDTPPAGLLSDALYLMQYSTVNLFVVNTKGATKRTLNVFHKAVKDNGIKNVYLILNGVKRRRNKYYARYGYGYGTGYGYGYGYGYQGAKK